MKLKHLLPGVIATIMLGSCQKELAPETVRAFCAVSGITIKNGGSKITARYDYEYDSVTKKVSMIRYQNLEIGTSKTIYPTYSKDTIYLSANSFLAFDASNRVEVLAESNVTPGKNLTYYYTYNSEGYVNHRLLDDGISDALRTNFDYANGALDSIGQDYTGFPQCLSASVSHANSSPLTSFNQFALLELFPELTYYLPMISLGKTPAYPLSEIENTIHPTNLPARSFTNTYSNYTLTPEGWLSAFQTDVVVNGVQKSTVKYEFEYKCF